MQWYKTGTINVTQNSDIITGISTDFITYGKINQGDMFTIDGSTFYEVKFINSETEIQLYNSFQEATQTGVTYAIIRSGTENLSNAQLATLVVDDLTQKLNFIKELNTWKAGTVDGGPNNDGEYPLTDAKGVTHLVACPAKIEEYAGGGAYNWAEYPEDQLVPEGDGTEYSAYHWAKKAEEDALAATNAEASVSPHYTAINTVATDIANVNTTATNIDNVNVVGQNIANINAVGSDITNVNTTATNIADINTVATDLNLVASNIETVATDIANVNATSSDINNVNTVATDINNVNTTATNIAVVNTVAMNILDIQNAEENALESKNWANYTVDQLVPEGDQVDDYSALHHAIKAAESAQSAAASYDSFDDRYLGAKSVEPTLDNDGNTLLVGALYFSSITNKVNVWDGAKWSPTATGALINKVEETLTAAKSSFAIEYDVSLGVEVYHNGIKLEPAAYTATDGLNVVLNTAAEIDDHVSITAYIALAIADIYTKAEVDANFVQVVDYESSTLPIQTLGSPTYTTQAWSNNLFASAGATADGYISDVGGGNVTVAAGSGFIKASDVDESALYSFDWPERTITVPLDTTVYIGVIYNGGNPVVDDRTVDNWDHDSEFSLGTVVNDDGVLYVMDNPWQTTDAFAHILERFTADQGKVSRDNEVGGLVLGESADNNRYITVSPGRLWSRFNKYPIAAFDSSGANTFDAHWRNGAGGWSVTTGVSQWDNTSYDDGTGLLASLTVNRYANLWFYATLDNDDVISQVYGQGEYSTSAAAELENPPADLPDHLEEGGVLIGRLIFQNGGETAIEVQSVFDTTFQATAAASHANLADLQGGTAGELYHLTSAELTKVNDLGTASTKDVTTSSTDTTAGRLLKVGDFGLGLGRSGFSVEDLNSIVIPGTYLVGPTAPNIPENASGILKVATGSYTGSNDRIIQDYTVYTNPATYFRTSYDDGTTWTPWQEIYHTGNILGTVSQDAGVPTGAIIERGSNSDGEYVKYADGTMICYSAKATSDTADVSITFPAVFSEAPTFLALARTGARKTIVQATNSVSTTGVGEYAGYSTDTGNRIAAATTWLAIGRWY